jgi:hypothetical protein
MLLFEVGSKVLSSRRLLKEIDHKIEKKGKCRILIWVGFQKDQGEEVCNEIFHT